MMMMVRDNPVHESILPICGKGVNTRIFMRENAYATAAHADNGRGPAYVKSQGLASSPAAAGLLVPALSRAPLLLPSARPDPSVFTGPVVTRPGMGARGLARNRRTAGSRIPPWHGCRGLRESLARAVSWRVQTPHRNRRNAFARPVKRAPRHGCRASPCSRRS